MDWLIDNWLTFQRTSLYMIQLSPDVNIQWVTMNSGVPRGTRMAGAGIVPGDTIERERWHPDESRKIVAEFYEGYCRKNHTWKAGRGWEWWRWVKSLNPTLVTPLTVHEVKCGAEDQLLRQLSLPTIWWNEPPIKNGHGVASTARPMLADLKVNIKYFINTVIYNFS